MFLAPPERKEASKMAFFKWTIVICVLIGGLSCGGGGTGPQVMEDGRIYVENHLPPPTDPRATNEVMATYLDEDLSREVAMIVPIEGGRKALGSECAEYTGEGKLFKGGMEVTVHIQTKTVGQAEKDIPIVVDGNRTLRILRAVPESGTFEYDIRT